MNVLPFTITLLSLLALMGWSLSSQRDTLAFHLLETRSFWEMERNLNKEYVRKSYKKKKKSNPSKSKDRKEAPSEEAALQESALHAPKSPRTPAILTPFQGVNVLPLLEGKSRLGWDKMYDIVATWIEMLYKETGFYRPRLGHDLLDALLIAYERHPELTTISELLAAEEIEDDAFYKMLKGSTTFQEKDALHCPPLELVLFMDDSWERGALVWKTASPSLLAALFSSEMAHKILAWEENESKKAHKHVCFHLTEFSQHFPAERAFQELIHDIQGWLLFSKLSKQTPSDSIVEVFDAKTGMRLR